MELKQIGLDDLVEPTFNVRSWISEEKLNELKDSIERVGVLEPLRVFYDNGKYEIQDGFRRYTAAKMAGVQVIPCVIVSKDRKVNEFLKLEANLGREDITPLEMARTLNMLQMAYGFSRQALANRIGRVKSRVDQLFSLLKLSGPIMQALEDKRISEVIAKLLMQIPGEDRRIYYLQYCLDSGVTVKTMQSWVAREKADASNPEPPPPMEGPPEEGEPYQPTTIQCRCCKKKFKPGTLVNVLTCGECRCDLDHVFENLRALQKEERDREREMRQMLDENEADILQKSIDRSCEIEDEEELDLQYLDAIDEQEKVDLEGK